MKSNLKKAFPFLVPLYQKTREFIRSLKTEESIFTEIFEKNLWNDKESASGTGSSLAATEQIRKTLPKIFEKYHVTSFLDAPCGDFLWMSQVNLNQVKYTGADIVKELISLNQNKFKEQGDFIVLNLIEDKIGSFDLIMCRECLVHLNNQQIKKVLSNIKKSNSKYLLLTTYPDQKKNIDIITGQWRALNMCLPPYNLPEPIEIFNDKDYVAGEYEKKIALWKIEDFK